MYFVQIANLDCELPLLITFERKFLDNEGVVSPFRLVLIDVFFLLCVGIVVVAERFDHAKRFQNLEFVHCKSFNLFNKWLNACLCKEVVFVGAFLLRYKDAVENIFVIVRVVTDAWMDLGANNDIDNLRIIFFRAILVKTEIIYDRLRQSTVVTRIEIV